MDFFAPEVQLLNSIDFYHRYRDSIDCYHHKSTKLDENKNAYSSSEFWHKSPACFRLDAWATSDPLPDPGYSHLLRWQQVTLPRLQNTKDSVAFSWNTQVPDLLATENALAVLERLSCRKVGKAAHQQPIHPSGEHEDSLSGSSTSNYLYYCWPLRWWWQLWGMITGNRGGGLDLILLTGDLHEDNIFSLLETEYKTLSAKIVGAM